MQSTCLSVVVDRQFAVITHDSKRASSRRVLHIYSEFSAVLPICNTKMSEKPAPAKLAVVESFKRSEDTACKSSEYSTKKKKEQVPSEKPMEKTKKTTEKVTKVQEKIMSLRDVKTEICINAPKVHEIRKAESAKAIKDNKSNISITDAEESFFKDIKPTENVNKMRDVKDIKTEICIDASKVTKIHEMQKTESAKAIKDNKSNISTTDAEESLFKDTKSTENVSKTRDVKDIKTEICIDAPEVAKMQKTESAKAIKDNKSNISTIDAEKSLFKDIKPTENVSKTRDVKDVKTEVCIDAPKIVKVHEMQKAESAKAIKDNKSNISTTDAEESLFKDIKLTENASKTRDVKDVKTEICIDAPEVAKVHEMQKAEFAKDIKDNKSNISSTAVEESLFKDTKSTENASKVRNVKDIKTEICTDVPEVAKIQKAEFAKAIKDNKSNISTTDAEESLFKDIKPTENASKTRDVKDVKTEICIAAPEVAKIPEMPKAESTKVITDNKSNISTIDVEENLIKDAKPTENVKKVKKIPVLEKVDLHKPWNVAVPRTRAPVSAPNLKERPLVLATHLVPSLPIGLFEVLAEIIEVITKKPVVLLHEPRIGRPVAKDVTDIAILPAAEDWKDGVLLPVSFVFEHHLNKNNSPCVYSDVIVAADRAPHVEDIMDLRGHRCAVPDRRNQISAAGLLFNHLHMKGESPAFFGNTLDASSQLAVLQMIAGKQAEVGVLEAPVIRCHKFAIPGVEYLTILASMGPLPPYRIMINKALVDKFAKEFATYLLSINHREEWLDRLSPFGIIGFAENSTDYYNLDDMKSVVTSVPYY